MATQEIKYSQTPKLYFINLIVVPSNQNILGVDQK